MSDPSFLLTRAVQNGDVETVKSFISSLSLSRDLKKPSLDINNFFGYNLLCDAIKMRHTEIAKELLISGVPVEIKDKRDNPTPLYLAVSNDNAEIVDIILKRDVDFSYDSDYGNILDLVVHTGNLKIAIQLMDHIAYVNSLRDRSNHMSFLTNPFLGCCNKFEEIVEMFLSRNSEIPMEKTIKTSLLVFAIQHEKDNIVKLMLELGADVNAVIHGRTVLQIAVVGGSFETIEHILRFCPDLNIKENEFIIRDAMNHIRVRPRERILDALLDYGFTICPKDANDGRLLHEAIAWDCLKIVKTLLMYGASVDGTCVECTCYNRCGTFLNHAADRSNLEIAKALIEHGADVNEKNNKPYKPYTDDESYTPMHYAIINADVNMLKLLLATGANAKENILLFAISCGNKRWEWIRGNVTVETIFELLKVLIEHGADVHAKDKHDSKTPIHYTVILDVLLQQDTKFDNNGKREKVTTMMINVIESIDFSGFIFYDDSRKAKMVEICLNRGAIVDAKNNDGYNALYAAIDRKLDKVVKVLVENGAKVDVMYDLRDYMTPLMIAVEENRLDMVTAILPSLPNFEIRDKRGRTALDICDSYPQQPEILLELLKYGADIYNLRDDTIRHCSTIEPSLNIRTIEMRALNHCVNSKYSRLSKSQQVIYDDCRSEIEEMKSTRFGESIFSVHDVLTKDTPILAVYMKNRDIVDALKTRDCVKKYVNMFPIYFGMIYYRFKKAIELEPLLTPCAMSLDSMIGFTLPYPVLMKILAYLNNKDLKILIKANPATD